MEGNPDEEPSLQSKLNLRQQQMENLLDMTSSLHDYNDPVTNSTKVPSDDFRFITQNEGNDDDNVGDITDHADEREVEKITYQDDDDISLLLTPEEITESDMILKETLEEDILIDESNNYRQFYNKLTYKILWVPMNKIITRKIPQLK